MYYHSIHVTSLLRIRKKLGRKSSPTDLIKVLSLYYHIIRLAAYSTSGQLSASFPSMKQIGSIHSVKVSHREMIKPGGAVLYPHQYLLCDIWCLRPRFCRCTYILGWTQTGPMRWILLWIMPQVQDRLIDLLTSSPARYHCNHGWPLTSSLFLCVLHYDIVYDWQSASSYYLLRPDAKACWIYGWQDKLYKWANTRWRQSQRFCKR